MIKKGKQILEIKVDTFKHDEVTNIFDDNVDSDKPEGSMMKNMEIFQNNEN